MPDNTTGLGTANTTGAVSMGVLGKTNMNFSQALIELKEGRKIARDGWNGKGMWLEVQRPDEHSKMTKPYIFMSIPAGATHQFDGQETYSKDGVERVPWLCSQTDMMAEDWMVVA